MERNHHRRRVSLVAAEVRAAIARSGSNALTVAGATDIPSSTLYRRLNGDSSFTVDELVRIASHLDVPVASFFAAPTAVAS